LDLKSRHGVARPKPIFENLNGKKQKTIVISSLKSHGCQGKNQQSYFQNMCATVDGRNPAPVDRWFIPLFIGFQPSKVVKDVLLKNLLVCSAR
jgi:hypothetical protein